MSPNSMESISTKRLRLVPISLELARLILGPRDALAAALDANVTAEWPQVDLIDAVPFIESQLAHDPGLVGWCGWLILTQTEPTLIGSVGAGRFGEDLRYQFGYGVLPSFEGKGFASEAALAIRDWALAQPQVEELWATTFERHEASKRILEKCGFELVGVSPDDATASESDRQGRGRLMLYRTR